MANSYLDQAQDNDSQSSRKNALLSFIALALLLTLAGLWLAGQVSGEVRVWEGPGLLVAIVLALAAGVSKTSSS